MKPGDLVILTQDVQTYDIFTKEVASEFPKGTILEYRRTLPDSAYMLVLYKSGDKRILFDVTQDEIEPA